MRVRVCAPARRDARVVRRRSESLTVAPFLQTLSSPPSCSGAARAPTTWACPASTLSRACKRPWSASSCHVRARLRRPPLANACSVMTVATQHPGFWCRVVCIVERLRLRCLTLHHQLRRCGHCVLPSSGPKDAHRRDGPGDEPHPGSGVGPVLGHKRVARCGHPVSYRGAVVSCGIFTIILPTNKNTLTTTTAQGSES
jgi:hypothetical protein